MGSRVVSLVFWVIAVSDFGTTPVFAQDPCVKEFKKIFTPHVSEASDGNSGQPSSFVQKDYVKPPSVKGEAPLRTSNRELQDLEAFLSKPLESSSTSPTQDLLTKAAAQLSPKNFQFFSDWFLAQLSEDPIINFEDHYLGRQRREFPEGPTRYNREGERPFDGYVAARQFLSKISLEKIDLKQILESHRKLMSRESIRESSGKVFQLDGHPPRNSQKLKDSELGVIRSQGVSFEVDGKHLPQGFSATGKTLLSLKDTNIYLRDNSDGFVNYAPLSKWRAIDHKTPVSDELVFKIRKLEEKYGVRALDREDVPEIRLIHQEFLKELASRIWKEAQEKVINANSRKEVIRAAAHFQRDFISVHPFVDGNGRLARLLTEKLLESRGIPAPVYTHWGEDVGLSRDEMEKVIGQGVYRAQKYQNELVNAITRGETFDTVLNPALQARVQELLGDPTGLMDQKGFLKWVQENREKYTNITDLVRDFSKTVDFQRTLQPALTSAQIASLKQMLGSDYRHFHPEEFALWRDERNLPRVSVEDDLKRYVEWLGKHVYEDHSGAIRLASPQFQRGFGRLSTNQTEFQEKMKNYYLDEPVYRGVPSNRFLEDWELVRLFTEASNFTIGNGVSVRSAPESALPVFQQFNLGLLRDGDFLSQQIVDHKNGTNNDYFMSGMVSFSENRGVAVHWHQNFTDPVGIIFTAKKRAVAVVNTAKHTEQFKKKGLANEFEEAMLGGTDPESLTSVEVMEHYPRTEKTSRRIKKATRLDFNRIQITEAELDDADRIRTSQSTLWEIQPDGRIRQIPPSQSAQ